MLRFSIIIPVYNTSKYLSICFDSLLDQGFDNYEVVVINDGSTDNSEDIINQYKSKFRNFKYIKQENSGLSVSRNNGVLNAEGDYLLFLDSDDYYEKNFLKKLDKEINKDYDVVRFQVQDVFSDGSIKKYNDFFFSDLKGVDSFNYICRNHYVEIACAYCFNRKFWLKNKFMFSKGLYHEDFGLIPLVLLKSSLTKSIDVFGYNYYQRNDSITGNMEYEKVKKRADDFLEHFKYLKNESLKISGDLSIFNSYISNSIIIKSTTLNNSDYKKYINSICKLGVFDMLLDDTFSRKVKRFLLKISPKLYYKIVRR